jgi:hypothetical protein
LKIPTIFQEIQKIEMLCPELGKADYQHKRLTRCLQQNAHGFKELRRHCHHGINCFKGLECEFSHHPKEIEYFTLKAQVKPKMTCDAGTQTDFEEPIPVLPPPAGFTDDDTTSGEEADAEKEKEPTPILPPPTGFTDDDTTSGEEADAEKEKYLWKNRKRSAAYMIRQGIKTLDDYDQITWRVKKKNVRPEVEAAKALVARKVRKTRAKQLIASGEMKREDFDKNYYQKQKRKLKIVE